MCIVGEDDEVMAERFEGVSIATLDDCCGCEPLFQSTVSAAPYL